jgi:RimJ/RimL family protein N-acetyltransferase
MQPPAFLLGRTVSLGPVDPSDAPLYARWVNDGRVRPFLNRPFPVTVDDERRRVESLVGATDAVGFSIRLRQDHALIGRTAIRSIHPVNRSAVFTVFIGPPEHWSRGLGKEATALTTVYAMDVLNLHRLELEVFAYNDRALRCYENLGFIREGARRQAKYHDGAYHDAILMAVTQPDWQAGLRERLREYLDPAAPEELWAATTKSYPRSPK